MERNNMTRIIYACVIAFFVLSFVTFVLLPLTADLRVFMASAHLASYKGVNLFYDAYNTWELKGVLNRVLMYMIHDIATLFSDFGTFKFERCVKFIYSIIILFFCLSSVLLVCPRISRLQKLIAVLSLATFFLANVTNVELQAEMSSLLFLSLGFALYINAEKGDRHETFKLLMAGSCIGITFFFKSATLIMSVSFVAAAYLWDVRHGVKPTLRKLVLLFAGSVTMLVIGFASILLINPDEMQDILYASMFQSTLLSGGEIHILGICHSFCYGFVTISLVRIPFLLIGVAALVFNIIASLKNGSYVSASMHIILWAMPALFIIISNRYFGYHYFTFVFPSIIEASMFAESVCVTPMRRTKTLTMTVTTALAAVLYAGTISVFSPITQSYITLTEEVYRQNAKYTAMRFDEPVLYLDDGIGAYVLGAASYLKYFYPLPIQRITENSEYKDAECRLESLRRIDQYKGKYVVTYNEWIFGNGKNEELKEKILREYDKIGEITRYTPQHKFLRCDTEADFIYFDLYQRKPDI